jgi:hypothetical protein
MIEQLTQEEQTYQANPNADSYVQLMKNDFGILQSFYRTYLASVGLTIGRDYYYQINDDAQQAYLTHDYEKQISFFNGSVEGRNAAFNSYKNERKNGQAVFGSALNNLTLSNDIRISDGTSGLPINSLMREGSTSIIDQYLTANPETVFENDGIAGLTRYVSDFLF